MKCNPAGPCYFSVCQTVLPGLKILPPPSPFDMMRSISMAYLGNMEFCIVQTGFNYESVDRQHLCITTFQIVDEEGSGMRIKTLHSTVRELYLPSYGAYIMFSFTPDGEDIESEQEWPLEKALDSYEEDEKMVSGIEEVEKSLDSCEEDEKMFTGIKEVEKSLDSYEEDEKMFTGIEEVEKLRDKAGIAGRVSLNILGYPLRPNEVECAYYLKNGQCKFGSTCKFHHPPPSNSPTTGQHSYPGGITNRPFSRASFMSPFLKGPSSYAPLYLTDSHKQTLGNSQIYATSRQSEPEKAGSQGTFSQYRSGSVPVGRYALQRDNVFPERPGQPECQAYMKTGDCKFGAVCRYNHPRERMMPAPDGIFSPISFPLRPGKPVCIHYSRYGICKFGPTCKFDHPMEIRRFLGSSSEVAALSLSSDGLVEASSANPRRLSLTETGYRGGGTW